MDAPQHEQRIQTACLLILTAVAIATALYWLRPVMIPFVLALFVAFGLTPLIDLQRRYLRVPRPIALAATVIVGFAVLGLLGALVSTSVGQLAANAEVYQTQIKHLLDRALIALPEAPFGLNLETAVESLIQRALQTVGRMLVGTTNAILGILSQGLLVMLFLVFLLLGGTAQPGSNSGILGEVEGRIQRYLVAKITVSAITGILIGTVLAVLGVDLAMVFGLFAFLLNFIPSVGSVIATLLPVPVVLVSPEISTAHAVLAIAVPTLIQFLIGNVIEPKIMGTSLDLHPVAILLALILWGMLWGVVGMLLATPITAVMKMLFERMEHTAPIADLLAGRLDKLRSP